MLTRTAVIGATGRLGTAVAARCDPSSTLIGVRNRAAATGETPIGADGLLRPADLVGKESLINCAGLATGSEADLHRVNVEFSEKLAKQAKAAGVRHFVQISSFRVFGRPEWIDEHTPQTPKSAYGQSKLRCERVLDELGSDEFQITHLRLPFMFSVAGKSLLASLVSLLATCRIMPVPSPSPQRSMITFDDAAYVVEQVVEREIFGTAHAADPMLFSFELLQEIFAREGRPIRMLRLPDWGTTLMGAAVPRVRNSLFCSNVLDPAINFAEALELPIGIERALAGLVGHHLDN